MREMQQQWGIKEMLENVLTQIRVYVSDVLYRDCVTSGPAVLVGLDPLRNSESNDILSLPFCC